MIYTVAIKHDTAMCNWGRHLLDGLPACSVIRWYSCPTSLSFLEHPLPRAVPCLRSRHTRHSADSPPLCNTTVFSRPY